MNYTFKLEDINPNLTLLNDHFEEIHEEFVNAKNQLISIDWGGDLGYYPRSINHPELSQTNNNNPYRDWRVMPLYGKSKDIMVQNQGASYLDAVATLEDGLIKHKYNVNKLPKLTEVLIKSGITKRVGISHLVPGKEIPWHIDPDPEYHSVKIIRGLFGIDVPAEEGKEAFLEIKGKDGVEKIKFENNKFILFHGRALHRVQNNLSGIRYCICFDTEVPEEILKKVSY